MSEHTLDRYLEVDRYRAHPLLGLDTTDLVDLPITY